jgi:hypothetical protein
MRNSFEDRFTKLGCFNETREDRNARIVRIARLRRLASKQPSAAERLVSTAEVRQQNGEHVRACVSIDSASASGFELGVWVNDHELSIRPRSDEGCTVAMRICADTVHGKVAIELPARCFTVERDLDAVLEECGSTVAPGTGFLLASQAQVSDGDGNDVCARLLHQTESPSGFVLEVSLACERTVVVRPRADDGKLLAIRLSGDSEYRACTMVEVEMPRHVMTAPARATP